jgi:electron transfer flavoprotein alpha subunit
MIAVIIVRDGILPAGFDEAICESDRRTLLVGSHLSEALAGVAPYSRATWTLEVDPSAVPMATMASIIAESLGHIDAQNDSIVLPASPDGRDIAPHLAYVLGHPLYAGATSIRRDSVTVSRHGGLHLIDVRPTTSFVATLQIGVRGADVRDDAHQSHDVVDLTTSISTSASTHVSASRSVETIEVQPPDASTMDLAEAPRILGGGAGLTDAEAFERLQRIAGALGASMGVTRVITDRGWADHNRQIGTTGVVVDPRLYISFGISGAVQHTSGLGHPDHIISVNTDAHCPMMQISDVAIVADANDVLRALESLVLATDRSDSTDMADA